MTLTLYTFQISDWSPTVLLLFSKYFYEANERAMKEFLPLKWLKKQYELVRNSYYLMIISHILMRTWDKQLINNEKNWNDAVVKETIYFESDSRERGVITNSCV